MALIHNTNLSAYAGVSKQAIDLRLPSYCEEMVNCYPTVQYGIRRRNPTQLISNDIIVSSNQFLHSYDRGLSGESQEQYLITIDDTNGLRVFDIGAGEYRTVTYSGAAAKYLESSNPEIGFSAITVQDTTFIANKDITPLREGETSITVNYSLLTVNMTGYNKNVYRGFFTFGTVINPTLTNLAPARIKEYKYISTMNPAISSVGATTTVTVDGIVIKYTVKTKKDGLNIYPESMGEYRSNLAKLIQSKLGNGYKVSLDSLGKVYVYDLYGGSITTTTSMSFPTSVPTPPPAVASYRASWYVSAEANNGSNPITISSGSTNELVNNASDYDKKAFVWIKQVSVDTAFPYTFYVTLKEINGTTIASTSSSATTSTGVASAFATWATGLADFTGVVSGSVVKITRDSGTDFEIVISDTYGDQASSAWKGAISDLGELPKTFPFKDTIVKIDGIDTIDNVSYWVKYNGNQWVEWRDPNMLSVINNKTMPHKLTRNSDYTFTLSTIDWDDILVGDEDSQSIPEFIGNGIKDLFFIGGRLGILTKNGVTLSQQGNFYNFFRTTILSLLDDSAITTYIDSSRSVGLEYAAELQGSIVFFGDKLQFALDASKPITPASISIQPISGFEINKNVKPISSGDSIFFLVANGSYSSLMEMNKSTISSTIRAMDVSSHVPNYIDSDIMQITISQRDNCLFLRSRTINDTIYVYKWMGTETEKMQTAWSKWTFDMDITSIISFNKELYLFGSRYDATVPLDEFSLAGTWDDTRYWLDETYWVDEEILANPSFERLTIEPYGVDGDFRDVGTTRYVSEVELSQWNLSQSSQKEVVGHLLIKTAEISSEIGSDFYLQIDDKERGTTRNIPAVYTVNRRPFISGNSKNMRIKIVSNNNNGFQINSISLEGQYNVRSKRV